MSKKAEKLNGSVDALAIAMRQVFQEATEKAVEPVVDLVGEVKEELVGVNQRLDHVDERMGRVETRLDSHQKALDGIKNRQPAQK